MEHEGDGDTNSNRLIRNGTHRLSKKTERVDNLKTIRDHPNYNIIGQNTEKSPGDLKRFAVAQTPVKNHQLIQV